MRNKLITSIVLAGGLLFSASSSAFAATANDVIHSGKHYIGKPYDYGAPIGDVNEFDCSSFTATVFKENGIDLPRTASEQAKKGVAVQKADLQAGDLVFFDTNFKGGIDHVGIYIGHNQMISAIFSGVSISDINTSYWRSRYVTARRILHTSENQTSTPTIHTVQSGESLWGISKKYGISVDDLKALNHLTSDSISPGEQLKVSVTKTSAHAKSNSNQNTNRLPVTDQTQTKTPTAVPIPLAHSRQNQTATTTSVSQENAPYKDVRSTFWAYQPIVEAKQLGLMTGVDSSKFEPNRGLTRAEAASILVRDLKLKEVPSNHVFKDVPKRFWAYSAIQAAYQHGLFHGDKYGNFNPQQLITREEMATVLYNLIGGSPIIKNPYTDVHTNDWAYTAILSMKQQGIFEGETKTTFGPNDTLTRAEAAALFVRLHDKNKSEF